MKHSIYYVLLVVSIYLFTCCFTGKEREAINAAKCRIGKDEWKVRKFKVSKVTQVDEIYYVYYTYLNNYGMRTNGYYGITNLRTEPCW